MQQIDLVHFAQIIQQASDAIFSTDASYIIKSWNAASENLYGFTAAEAVGKRLGALVKTAVAEKKRNKDLEKLHNQGFYEGEYEFYTKAGTWICVHVSITVLRGVSGEISGYVAIHRNISERKKIEENLKNFNTRLEEQVKKNTGQLRNIFERITDAFVALDSNWRYTYLNKKAGEILSREPESLIGKNIWKEFPEGVGLPFYNAYHKAMSEQHYIHLEEYYPPYNRWLENHIYPSPEGLSIFFRDITAHRLIEEEAKLSNQRLLLHLTNSPLAVVEWDKSLVITSWSDQAEAIFEWTKTEAVGKLIEELNLVYHEDVDRVTSAIDSLFKGSISRLKVINRNNTKSGRIVYCEWYNSVLKDDHGNVASCMSLVQDVTEKKRAEDIITFNEQQLNLIYNSSTDILFLLAVEQPGVYKFISVNKAFKTATGLTDEQVLNRYLHEVIPQPSLQLVLSKYKEAIESRRTVYWEETTSYPTGVKTGLVSVTPVFDNTEGGIRLVGSVHDITEIKRAEAELKEKNEQLRNLSAHLQDIREEERTNIAREIHDELGERLTGIRLDISWIESQLSAGLNPVKEKFPGLIELVDDTIKTVRKISTELRPSLLDDFGLTDALEWQAAEFEKRTGINCTVKSFLSENINNKKIDITLFRIFQESLTNVVRHAKAKNVYAQLTQRNNRLELRITDDGIGMDLDAVKNKQTLGLMGMKERILMVNGEYNITSEIGKGTSIVVSVP